MNACVHCAIGVATEPDKTTPAGNAARQSPLGITVLYIERH